MPHLISGINRRMLARDGLHLSYKGTEHAVNCIEGAIHMLWTTKERVQRRLSAMIPPTSTEATPPSTQTETTSTVLASEISTTKPRPYSDVAATGLPIATPKPQQTSSQPTPPTAQVTEKQAMSKLAPTLKKRPTPAPRRSQPLARPPANQWIRVVTEYSFSAHRI